MTDARRSAPRPLRFMFGWLDRLERGSIVVVAPDGARFHFAGREPGPSAELRIMRTRMVRRTLLGGDIGLAEAYMDGDWDTPDLAALLGLIGANEHVGEVGYGRRFATFVHRIVHWARANTRAGSRRNIAAHYDLGNEFYASWLDPTMTYSSAVYPAPGADLQTAQENKYRLICDKLQLSAGQRLLEIGCGWGGFASFAARRYGAKVTAITVSKAQHAHASAQVQREGLGEKVDVKLIDYRDVPGQFDKVASIEAFEAIGERYWPVFFERLRARLAPGGRAALQVITIDDKWFDRYRRKADFIQRYIFPGGMLPSPGALARESGRAGFATERTEFFGQHYADTLATWNHRFQTAWNGVAARGFDERFKRMWEFYLAYCEAGFRTRVIDVAQVALVRA